MLQHQWFLCGIIIFNSKRNKEINPLWHTSAAHFNTSHHTAAEWGESKRTVSRTTHHHPGTAWKPAGGWTVSGLAACSTYNRRNWRQMLLLLPSEGRCDVTGCRGNTAEEEVVPGNTWTAGWHAGGSFNGPYLIIDATDLSLSPHLNRDFSLQGCRTLYCPGMGDRD